MYLENRAFELRFVPHWQHVIDNHAPRARPVMATAHQDLNEATDIVLRQAQTAFACRIRRFEYYTRQNWRDEITMRSRCANGGLPELDKILRQGWADYFCYGFANHDETGILSWVMLDLDAFRTWAVQQHGDWERIRGTLPAGYQGQPWPWRHEVDNRDGTAFVPFYLADPMPANCHHSGLPFETIVAEHRPHKIAARQRKAELQASMDADWRRIFGPDCPECGHRAGPGSEHHAGCTRDVHQGELW